MCTHALTGILLFFELFSQAFLSMTKFECSHSAVLDNLHANSGHSRFGFVHYTDYLDVENAVTEIFKNNTK